MRRRRAVVSACAVREIVPISVSQVTPSAYRVSGTRPLIVQCVHVVCIASRPSSVTAYICCAAADSGLSQYRVSVSCVGHTKSFRLSIMFSLLPTKGLR